jgi:hypothetical protein
MVTRNSDRMGKGRHMHAQGYRARNLIHRAQGSDEDLEICRIHHVLPRLTSSPDGDRLLREETQGRSVIELRRCVVDSWYATKIICRLSPSSL